MMTEEAVRKLKIGSMVSGNGSVLKTMLRVCDAGEVPGEVVAVASNKDCPALDVAREAGIAARAFPATEYASRENRDDAIARFLVDGGTDFIVVGGYSEVLEPSFFQIAPEETISMYPASLPAFGELEEAIGPALDYGVKHVAVTIHFRAPLALSNGPIIAQEALPVDVDDTIESVTQRVIKLESRFLPSVLRAFAEGRVSREGARVRVDGGIDVSM